MKNADTPNSPISPSVLMEACSAQIYRLEKLLVENDKHMKENNDFLMIARSSAKVMDDEEKDILIYKCLRAKEELTLSKTKLIHNLNDMKQNISKLKAANNYLNN